jgi:hypothetical protein
VHDDFVYDSGAAAWSRPHCRQRHRCSLRWIRRLPGVSGCPLPQWLGISSRRILRRSILGKWTTAVLLVQVLPPLPHTPDLSKSGGNT